MTHRPDVELRLPAESAYVAVLRMTTAGLAARLDFTLDDIEDLRMAVGEACALVLEHADPAATCTPRSTSATAPSGSRSRPTPSATSSPTSRASAGRCSPR